TDGAFAGKRTPDICEIGSRVEDFQNRSEPACDLKKPPYGTCARENRALLHQRRTPTPKGPRSQQPLTVQSTYSVDFTSILEVLVATIPPLAQRQSQQIR